MGVGISFLIALKATILFLCFAYLKNLGFTLFSPPFLYSSLISFLVSIASHPSINLPILLGKTTDGSFPLFSLIIFSPYIYFVRIFSLLRRLRSGEPTYTQVHEGLYVGGWPPLPQKLPPGDPPSLIARASSHVWRTSLRGCLTAAFRRGTRGRLNLLILNQLLSGPLDRETSTSPFSFTVLMVST